ncbi:MAG: hypothetical protein Q7R49_05780 [Candidatus Daviesbacteria bacterium]|nr:hypothetical protein [Candidatus Daviesbacteria bacterium]
MPKVTYEGSESSKVPQEAAPTVDAGKPVGKDLQPPHPFPWGWISS